MKNNYIGSLFIAFSIGTLIFFAGAHACESFPALAKWVGGECWFESSPEEEVILAEESILNETIALKAQGLYLKAHELQGSASDDEVIKAAVYALAQNGTSEAVATLKKLARTHESIDTRKAALYALAQCASSEELASFYRDIAENGDVLALRKAAVYAIGQMGDQDSVDILYELATSAHHVSLRKAAVHALQNCETEAAQKALYKILAKVSDSL